jgi:hypothetical protein
MLSGYVTTTAMGTLSTASRISIPTPSSTRNTSPVPKAIQRSGHRLLVRETTSVDMEIAPHCDKSQMPTAGHEGISAAQAKLPTHVSPLEPFVDSQTVAEFLAVRRAEVLRLTREGKIRGYAYRGQQRHVYRYRLSEVNTDFAALLTPVRCTIPEAAPVSQRRKSSNG